MNKKAIITSLLALIWIPFWGQENSDFLYIFPSKEIYETGEDMWFKAYLMDRQTLALSDKSQTLYLQLKDQTGDVVWSEKYPLTAGRGDGHVYVGDNWQQGDYFIEGFTRSSFTTDSTIAIRPRRIRLVDRVTQMDSISSEAFRNDSIQRLTAKHRFDLFPEGGNLIDGVNTIVAFKATYGNGWPEDVSGVVTENGREIATIRSIHEGMGMFALCPHSGKDYKVVLSDGKSFPFPTIEPSGLTLRVSRNNNSGITLLISASDTTARQFTIFAKMRGILCCSAKGTVRGQQKVKLPIDKFPTQGIVEITLTEGDVPIAERLVYINPTQQLIITAKPNRKQYNRRDESKTTLMVTNSSGQPVKAELALSVFDKAYLYQPGHESILSHCFLSEEIRGNIFNPTYYFDEENQDRLQALDLLLMTQGWRRYVWDKKPSQEHQILYDGVCGKDFKERWQYIQAFTPQSDTCLVMTDSLGRFEIEPSIMETLRGNIYLKPLVKSPKARLSLVVPFDTIKSYQQGRERYLPQHHIFKTEHGERDITNGFGTVVLKDIYVNAKRRSPYRDKVMGSLDSLAILASGEWVCNCKAFGTEGYLNDYHGYSHHPESAPPTPGLKRSLPKRGKTYRVIKYVPTGRYLVDVDMDDPPHNIVYYGPQYSEEDLLKKYNMWKAQGYYPKRVFYEPDPAELMIPTPDARNTLQWKPALLTDENGKAEVSFTTSDVNTEFIGIVEAIDGTGLLGYQTFTFRVIKNK